MILLHLTKQPRKEIWIAGCSFLLIHILASSFFSQYRWITPLASAAWAALAMLLCIVEVRSSQPALRLQWIMLVVTCMLGCLAWLISAYYQVILRSAGFYVTPDRIINLLRFVPMLFVLISADDNSEGNLFRFIDLSQGVIITLGLTVLLYPHFYGIRQEPLKTEDVNIYQETLFVFLSISAFVTLFFRNGASHNRSIQAVALLAVSYTCIMFIVNRVFIALWDAPPGSILFIMLDFPYAMMVAFLLITQPRIAPIPSQSLGASFDKQIVFPTLFVIPLFGLAIALSIYRLRYAILATFAALILQAARSAGHHALASANQRAIIRDAKREADLLIELGHEIRSPLGSVTLNASLLARSFEEQSPHASIANDIHHASEAVLVLLNDMIDLSHLKSGRVAVRIDRSDICEIAERAIAIARALATDSNVSLELQTSQPQFIVSTDRKLVQQILVNLLFNAVRFTPAGGHVRMSVHPESGSSEGMLRIMVEDDGLGIPIALQPKLFERFTTSEKPLNGSSGSGLGLAICAGLVSLLKGSISFASVPGEGSRFWVLLPNK